MRRQFILIFGLLTLVPILAWGQQDMTDYVKGANGDDGQYWYIVGKSSPVYAEGVATNLH